MTTPTNLKSQMDVIKADLQTITNDLELIKERHQSFEARQTNVEPPKTSVAIMEAPMEDVRHSVQKLNDSAGSGNKSSNDLAALATTTDNGNVIIEDQEQSMRELIQQIGDSKQRLVETQTTQRESIALLQSLVEELTSLHRGDSSTDSAVNSEDDSHADLSAQILHDVLEDQWRKQKENNDEQCQRMIDLLGNVQTCAIENASLRAERKPLSDPSITVLRDSPAKDMTV